MTERALDMSRPPVVVSDDVVYRGAVFRVDDMRIDLPARDGGAVRIRRQITRHSPCVVMLVHDTPSDRYLVEREYRAGSGIYAYGLPAGLIEPGEEPVAAALRELAEETGVVPEPGACRVERAADCYSSEGMSDELAHIMVLHLDAWRQEPRHFDADEYVESFWTDWQTLRDLPVTASNSIIAIQHEAIRRLRAGLDS